MPHSNPADMVMLYEHLGEPMMLDIGNQALAMLAIEDGQRLIDVGTRTGGLAVAAARKGCQVLATDSLPPMVQRAAERLTEFPGSEAKVMDPAALDVADGSFDAATSMFGVISDKTWRSGLAEMLRALRVGGRIAVGMWTDDRDASPEAILRRVFETEFAGRALRPADYFPQWSAESLGAALEKLGFDDVDVQIFRSTWSPRDLDGRPVRPEHVLEVTDPIFRVFPGYRELSDDERRGLRRSFGEAIAEYADSDGGVRMPVAAYVGVGRRG